MDSTIGNCRYRTRNKAIVIMGATGTGKSRLSIDIGTRFPSEIINSDKVQVYKGLNITTNKIPMSQRLGVPHHLLGEFDTSDGELSPAEFREIASSVVTDISVRRRIPILAGGSNSFIHAFLSERFNPDSDVFDGLDSPSAELRYNCCFLWVDVSTDVLCKYLLKRVDEMFDDGMFEELVEFYDSFIDSGNRVGITKAIGVPEFAEYFRRFPARVVAESQSGGGGGGGRGDRIFSNAQVEMDVRRALFNEAVTAIKENTCQLAKRQMGKIQRLRLAGWNLHRLDATKVFDAVLSPDSGKSSSEIWEKEVMEPSVKIVKHFLEE